MEDLHIVDLLLTVPAGLIEFGGEPFSYRPLRQYLESLGWVELFSDSDRLVGIITEGIDTEGACPHSLPIQRRRRRASSLPASIGSFSDYLRREEVPGEFVIVPPTTD
jgi:hypothetical protein